MIYIDDIIVFGKNFNEHLERVEEVLERILLAGLKLKAKKCELQRTEVVFLGQMCLERGLVLTP